MQKLTHLALLPLLALVGPLGCDRGNGPQDDEVIDIKSMADQNPSADRPTTDFPARWQQADPQVNAFINDVLKSCEKGDYDEFCRFMGTLEVPPSFDDFKRIWQGVREIAVRSVRSTSDEPPQYFVHAVVRLRRPDAQRRTERDIVLRVFREMDHWRIAGAPKELLHKILAADSQPASGPAEADSVHPATAPASGA